MKSYIYNYKNFDTFVILIVCIRLIYFYENWIHKLIVKLNEQSTTTKYIMYYGFVRCFVALKLSLESLASGKLLPPRIRLYLSEQPNQRSLQDSQILKQHKTF